MPPASTSQGQPRRASLCVGEQCAPARLWRAHHRCEEVVLDDVPKPNHQMTKPGTAAPKVGMAGRFSDRGFRVDTFLVQPFILCRASATPPPACSSPPVLLQTHSVHKCLICAFPRHLAPQVLWSWAGTLDSLLDMMRVPCIHRAHILPFAHPISLAWNVFSVFCGL